MGTRTDARISLLSNKYLGYTCFVQGLSLPEDRIVKHYSIHSALSWSSDIGAMKKIEQGHGIKRFSERNTSDGDPRRLP